MRGTRRQVASDTCRPSWRQSHAIFAISPNRQCQRHLDHPLGDAILGRCWPGPARDGLTDAVPRAAVIVGPLRQANNGTQPGDRHVILNAELLDLSETASRPVLSPCSIAWRPPTRSCSFQFPIDVSDTPCRRAASAWMRSPERSDSTIFSFTSTGCFTGLATTVLLTDRWAPGRRARALVIQPAAVALGLACCLHDQRSSASTGSTNDHAQELYAGYAHRPSQAHAWSECWLLRRYRAHRDPTVVAMRSPGHVRLTAREQQTATAAVPTTESHETRPVGAPVSTSVMRSKARSPFPDLGDHGAAGWAVKAATRPSPRLRLGDSPAARRGLRNDIREGATLDDASAAAIRRPLVAKAQAREVRLLMGKRSSASQRGYYVRGLSEQARGSSWGGAESVMLVEAACGFVDRVYDDQPPAADLNCVRGSTWS